MAELEPLVLADLPAVLEQASSHATTNVPIARPDELAGEVRARLVGNRYDTVADIPVCVGWAWWRSRTCSRPTHRPRSTS